MSQESRNEAVVMGYDFSEYAGKGGENAPPPQLPTLRIIHSKSKGLGVAGKPLEKGKVGQIWLPDPFIMAESVKIIPCNMMRLWQEWSGKSGNAGVPLSAFSERPHQATWIDKEGLRMPSGTYVSETHTYFVLVWDGKTDWVKAKLNMAKTQLGASFEWLKTLQQKARVPKTGELKQPPYFARVFNFDTKRESNSENSWDAWHQMDLGSWLNPSSQEFQKGLAFYLEANEIMQKMAVLDPKDLAKSSVDDEMPI